jgi:CubicO group peptidase (beta-lactamase class C family)
MRAVFSVVIGIIAGILTPLITLAQSAVPLERDTLEIWLDGLLPHQLRSGDIAGAVVVVVKDGQVLLQKGYGYADAAAHKPVDPDSTLFRPGSVSKLFTATAVMQLVEQGKLDLDTDVNKYLDFKIPERYGKPITLRNLLTHTAGFEEQGKDLKRVNAEAAPPLGEQLKQWVPERIFPPGETPAYSNYGVSIAGYIVERVSGESFPDYIARHIFAPLGMEHSSFHQPLPPQLLATMSKGYDVASDSPKYYEMISNSPAGGLASTGADMARFMIAHLRDGEYGSQRILQAATAQQMHTSALTLLPAVNRMLLGFYEFNDNGHRVIGHSGDTQWFHAELRLFVDEGVGVYFAVNSQGKEGASIDVRSSLFEGFADRYFPGSPREGKVAEDLAAQHAQLLAGRYEGSRRADSSFLSLLDLALAPKVVVHEDGAISMGGGPKRYREIEPFVWREVDGKMLLAAKVDAEGAISVSTSDVSPYLTYQRIPWWRAPSWLRAAIFFGLLALLGTLIAWPIAARMRRRYQVALPLSPLETRGYVWARLAILAAVGVFTAWIFTIGRMMTDFSRLSPEQDGWLMTLQLTSLVVFIGAVIVTAWNAWLAWHGQRRWSSRLWNSVIAVACAVLLWTAFAFHLIAFDVNY